MSYKLLLYSFKSKYNYTILFYSLEKANWPSEIDYSISKTRNFLSKTKLFASFLYIYFN